MSIACYHRGFQHNICCIIFKNVSCSQWILSNQKQTMFHVKSSYVHARTMAIHCFDYFQVTLTLDRNDIMASTQISVGHFKCVLWLCSTYFMHKTGSMQFSAHNLLWFHLPGFMFLLYKFVNCPGKLHHICNWEIIHCLLLIKNTQGHKYNSAKQTICRIFWHVSFCNIP